jgi:purine nucleoside phosphorylase
MSMKVFGLSVITNNGLDLPEHGNQHNEVVDVAQVAAPNVESVLGAVIESLPTI